MAIRTIACASGAWLIAFAGTAVAAGFDVQVIDGAGAAAADVVVYAEPTGGHAAASAPKGAVIDQVNKEFVPRVSVVQTGAAVRFPNKDDFRHQVYSFSPAKVFQLKLYHGVPSQPVVFDKPGPVVLGCNIHDRMVGYVLVVDTPHFTKTDARGHARLEGLAPGEYDVKAWQPLASGGSSTVVQRIRTSPDGHAAPVLKLQIRSAN